MGAMCSLQVTFSGIKTSFSSIGLELQEKKKNEKAIKK
jgi:hypothetical protein